MSHEIYKQVLSKFKVGDLDNPYTAFSIYKKLTQADELDQICYYKDKKVKKILDFWDKDE